VNLIKKSFTKRHWTNQLILLGTLDYLAEQLLAIQNKSNLKSME